MKLMIAAFGAAALLAGTAQAQTATPTGGMTVQEISDWLTKQGYAAAIVPPPAERPAGAPKTVGAVRSSESGATFLIIPMDCGADDRCRSVQFSAQFNLPAGAFTVERANEWNSSRRYAKLIMTPTGAVRMVYDVNILPIGYHEMLSDNFGVWRMMLGNLRAFLAPPSGQPAASSPTRP